MSTSSNRPVYVAAAVGLAAVGTLAGLQSRPPRRTLRVVSQTVDQRAISETVDAFGERHRTWAPGIRIGYEVLPSTSMGPELKVRPVSDEGELETAREGPLVVPLGYAKPPTHPRLELWQGDRLIATAPLAPFPPSPRRALVSKPDALLRALARPSRGAQGDSSLVFTARRPLVKGESWRISPLRTEGVEGPFDRASLYPGAIESTDVPLPWIGDARAVEIEATRMRTREIRHDYRIEGLRLVDHNGATALRVPHDYRFVDRTNDLELLIPKSENGPPRRTRSIDQRSPVAYLYVRSLRGEKPKVPARFPMGSSAPMRRRDGRIERYTAFIVAPRPEALNVRALGLGGGLVASAPPRGPVVRAPFTAVVRVTLSWEEPIGRFHAIIPIERAASSPTSR